MLLLGHSLTAHLPLHPTNVVVLGSTTGFYSGFRVNDEVVGILLLAPLLNVPESLPPKRNQVKLDLSQRYASSTVENCS